MKKQTRTATAQQWNGEIVLYDGLCYAWTNKLSRNDKVYAVSNCFFSESITGTYEAIAPLLDKALAALKSEALLNNENAFFARLCLEEALVNAIRHGNCENPSLDVKVEMDAEGDQCRIRVYDEGCGFCPDAVPCPAGEEPGGRGVCLIRYYMDEVVYNQQERCLEMIFHRPDAS